MVRKTARSCSEFNKCLDGNHGVPYVRFAILKAIFFFRLFHTELLYRLEARSSR